MEALRPNCIYHIFNHANGDENIFRTEENYRFFNSSENMFILQPQFSRITYCRIIFTASYK